MPALRIIDDHLELDNIGTYTHSQVDAHIDNGLLHFSAVMSNIIVDCDIDMNSHKICALTSISLEQLGYIDCEGQHIIRLDNVNDNLVWGRSAGNSLAGGNNNIFMGYEAGNASVTASNNIAVGYKVGYTLSSGDHNVLMGYEAGYYNTVYNYNVMIGYQAGKYKQSSHNVCIGYKAARGASPGTANRTVAIGALAGYLLSTGYDNVCIGYNAGYNIYGGDQNVFIGSNAGYRNRYKNCNIMIGFESGYANRGGLNNTYVGYRAGKGYGSTGSASYNVAVGHGALQNINDTNSNVALGAGALLDQISSANTIAIGYGIGDKGGETSDSILIGYNAGYYHSGDNTLWIGGCTESPLNEPLMYGNIPGSSHITDRWLRINSQFQTEIFRSSNFDDSATLTASFSGGYGMMIVGVHNTAHTSAMVGLFLVEEQNMSIAHANAIFSTAIGTTSSINLSFVGGYLRIQNLTGTNDYEVKVGFHGLRWGNDNTSYKQIR